jgi:hypothetical protein
MTEALQGERRLMFLILRISLFETVHMYARRPMYTSLSVYAFISRVSGVCKVARGIVNIFNVPVKFNDLCNLNIKTPIGNISFVI